MLYTLTRWIYIQPHWCVHIRTRPRDWLILIGRPRWFKHAVTTMRRSQIIPMTGRKSTFPPANFHWYRTQATSGVVGSDPFLRFPTPHRINTTLKTHFQARHRSANTVSTSQRKNLFRTQVECINPTRWPRNLRQLRRSPAGVMFRNARVLDPKHQRKRSWPRPLIRSPE